MTELYKLRLLWAKKQEIGIGRKLPLSMHTGLLLGTQKAWFDDYAVLHGRHRAAAALWQDVSAHASHITRRRSRLRNSGTLRLYFVWMR
ncbi:hypothetical protein DUZ99_15860 [Xylanibacillus composti]|uniref:Uncharacterized protein n=1 Tax=Xylanibacillus composti TaxID=1572762 RepID=A0A8J4M402_9BACL|nr:hypothetical protein [Xylanibacillus composti]GIQ71389.1 hypothetical protein XYCOK13_42130 [Xylanibacillus composti]